MEIVGCLGKGNMQSANMSQRIAQVKFRPFVPIKCSCLFRDHLSKSLIYATTRAGGEKETERRLFTYDNGSQSVF